MTKHANPVSTMTNGRKPKNCLGRVFKAKLGNCPILHSKCLTCIKQLLEP